MITPKVAPRLSTFNSTAFTGNSTLPVKRNSTSSVISPNRRPRKRMRENAYAPSAHRSTVTTLVTIAMISELTYQVPYGIAGSVKRRS